MKKRNLMYVLISICFILMACGGRNNSDNMQAEENIYAEESSEEKRTEQEEDTDTDDSEKLEMDRFEDEMYDPVKSVEPGDMVTYEEEHWWQQAEPQEITYRTEDYGEIQEYGSEFYYEEDVMGFYYNLETFYLNSEFLYTMNETLDKVYDDYLYQYRETEERYMEQGKESFVERRVPYSELVFLGIQYAGQDYVSLLFNDVTYMGGAHPYSFWDAVTIDCCTGEEVNASEVLGIDDDEILEVVNDLMGLEEDADWGHLDFYLQEDTIVFFYRMPGFWEDVVLNR